MSTDIRLGVYRDTMYTNPLLRKASLGKPMQRGFDLPNEHFVYGQPNHCIDGGAEEAMRYMIIQAQNKKKEEEGKSTRDFVKLNKAAVQAGLTKSSEQYAARELLSEAVRKNGPKVDASKVVRGRNPPDMTFGICTRPSTPVFELLEHSYQTKWLLGQQKKQNQNKQCESSIRKPRKYVPRRLKYIDNAVKSEEKPKDVWQMPKWKKIGSKSGLVRDDQCVDFKD